jgi:hypothetical protein
VRPPGFFFVTERMRLFSAPHPQLSVIPPGRHLATLDYGPISETVISTPWTDPDSKPLDDLKLCIRNISSQSNNLADIVVFGSQAASLFENAESVQVGFDRRFIMPGELAPRQKEWGLTTLGTWRGLDLLINERTAIRLEQRKALCLRSAC